MSVHGDLYDELRAKYDAALECIARLRDGWVLAPEIGGKWFRRVLVGPDEYRDEWEPATPEQQAVMGG